MLDDRQMAMPDAPERSVVQLRTAMLLDSMA
jgi:hypothetical protein